jgi:hypothetical protein
MIYSQVKSIAGDHGIKTPPLMMLDHKGPGLGRPMIIVKSEASEGSNVATVLRLRVAGSRSPYARQLVVGLPNEI